MLFGIVLKAAVTPSQSLSHSRPLALPGLLLRLRLQCSPHSGTHRCG